MGNVLPADTHVPSLSRTPQDHPDNHFVFPGPTDDPGHTDRIPFSSLRPLAGLAPSTAPPHLEILHYQL